MTKDEDYAIVMSGGKQHRVSVGDTVRVERLPQEPGAAVDLNEVLLVSRKGDVRLGAPLVPGAKVKAKVVDHGRDDKVTVFKYKSKVRYRRKTGHRQHYTDLAIERINVGRSQSKRSVKAKSEEAKEDE
jgi:large subunit ribosomal protein L21